MRRLEIKHATTRLLVLFAGLALGLGAVACTEEQQIEDQPPTEPEQAEAEQAQQPQQVEIEEVGDNPDMYEDQTVVGETYVHEVVSDRAFLVGEEGEDPIFTVFVQPGESPTHIEAGQRIRLEGMVAQRQEVTDEMVEQLPPDARQTFQGQSHALMVSQRDKVAVLEQAPADMQRDDEMAEGEQPDEGEMQRDDEMAEGDQPEQQEQTKVTIGGEEYENFEDWDVDDDQQVTRQEFTEGVAEQGVFDDLDADDDDVLAQEEFREWMWSEWDTNADGEITEEEFTAMTDQWNGDVEWGSFEEWNTDQDEVLTSSEFQTGMQQVGVYDDWDLDDDDAIDQDEFVDGLFGLWDDDGDGALDEDELGFDEPEEEGVTRR